MCAKYLHLSIGPNFSAMLYKMSVLQNAGIRMKIFPVSVGNRKPSLCNNNINGLYNITIACSLVHDTTGIECCFTKNKQKENIQAVFV